MSKTHRGYLLVDANVLIDYLASDLSVLTLASRSLGDVHVLSTVLDGEIKEPKARCIVDRRWPVS